MADTGTNVDLAPVKEVTPEMAAAFELDPPSHSSDVG